MSLLQTCDCEDNKNKHNKNKRHLLFANIISFYNVNHYTTTLYLYPTECRIKSPFPLLYTLKKCDVAYTCSNFSTSLYKWRRISKNFDSCSKLQCITDDSMGLSSFYSASVPCTVYRNSSWDNLPIS